MVPRPQSVDVYSRDDVEDDTFRARPATTTMRRPADIIEPDSTRKHSNDDGNRHLDRVPQQMRKQQQQQQPAVVAHNRVRQRLRMKFSSMVFVFFVGFISTAILSFVHLHRFEYESYSPGTMIDIAAGFRGYSPPRNDPDSTKVTPEVSACLIVMDDNHFLIGKTRTERNRTNPSTAIWPTVLAGWSSSGMSSMTND